MGNEFLDLAKLGRHQRWTYLLGISLVVASGIAGFSIGKLLSKTWEHLFSSVDSVSYWCVTWLIHDVSFDTLGNVLCLIIVIRVLHRRPFLSLITTGDHINWKLLKHGFGLYFLLFSAAMLIDQFLFSDRQFAIHLPRFSETLQAPDSNVTIPIGMISATLWLAKPIASIVNSTGEELLFRGYILQGLGLVTRNRVLLALLVGFLFMVGHLSGSEIHPLLVFEGGVFLTIVTLKSNGLELAIGMHIAHNLAGTLITYGIGYKAVYLNILFPICAFIMYLVLFRRTAMPHPETEEPKNAPRSFNPSSE